MNMEDLVAQKPLKTYSKIHKVTPQSNYKTRITVIVKREPLTTKKALELLLNGTLKQQVCRYCMSLTNVLNNLDQIMHICGKDAMYKVSIRDMVATVHPFKAVDDPNFPNKVCEKCLNEIIRSYHFAQQCERSERALRNCFNDMYDKLEKLDPLERTKKRGRQKLNPNRNILHTEHRYVIDYADPILNLINSGTVPLTNEPTMSDLECKRCWQVLPNIESLVNHEKIHPKTMWYNCRLCGKSFSKKFHLKKHLQCHKKKLQVIPESDTAFECKECGRINDDYQVHLQHIEKHKFGKVLEHLLERKMDKLCSVCLENGSHMTELDKTICLHGGYPELTGERSLFNILGAIVPEMNQLHNYTGTKICSKCLDHAIISYIFTNKVRYIRQRLNICLKNMLENLNNLPKVEDKIFIEIADNGIMPIREDDFDDNLLLDDNEIDENKLIIQVLEDEFRLKSESESDNETTSSNKNYSTCNKVAKQTVENKEFLVNGYQKDINSKTKAKNNQVKSKSVVKFTCPICDKHFISEYFLKKHILKHRISKTSCKICLLQFTSKFNLHEHMKMAHLMNDKMSTACNVCNRAFSSEIKKNSHEGNHKFRRCDLCLKVFRSQPKFNNHMERHAMRFNVHRQNTIQNCSFCEKEYTNDNALTTHVNKSHLQIKPYTCDMCEKQFYTQKNLKWHKKLHSLPSNEKCEFCTKTLKSRKELVIHIRKHIGIKPHQCLLCSQTFYSESLVFKHMNKWHGGRFCCKLCKKVFVNKIGLKNHVNIAHFFF